MDVWRDRAIGSVLTLIGTGLLAWLGGMFKQPVINAEHEGKIAGHEQRIGVLEREIKAIPEQTADRVVRELRKER